MKRILLGLVVVGLVGAAAAFSRQDKPVAGKPAGDLVIRSEARNPWTSINLNNDPDEFQFAIVSDRTGGHRPQVFSRAVERLNWLQPEFVLSVGDLIEGGSTKPVQQLNEEWQEFQGYVKRLKVPFFYVPGNHDVAAPAGDKLWGEKFGRRHYHFVYKNVLFLCLNTDDPPGGTGSGNLGKEQVAYAKEVLGANRDVRWTIVALHKPIWTSAELEKTGWLDVEKALVGRNYMVFCGHVHRYRKFVRQGMSYYQLATTGGGSRMRGPAYGEFDHIMWVTMKKTGPVLANILLDAILPDNLQTPPSTEKGVSTASRKPTYPVQGKVYFEGSPVPQAYVAFTLIDPKETRPTRAEGVAEADGSFTLTTYRANDGAPAGDYTVTVVWRRPFYDPAGRVGPNLLPEKYAKPDTSGLKATVTKEGPNEFVFELRK
jgi:hypothetical protein